MQQVTKNSSFCSQRLLFRGIQVNDTDTIVRWRSDPALIQYSISTIPLNRAKHLEWFQHYINTRDRYDFLIIEKQSKQPVGIIGLRNLDSTTQSAEISILIGDHPKQGFATESICALLTYAKQLKFKRIWAQVHNDNLISIHLFEKCNFQFIKQNSIWKYYEHNLYFISK